MTCLRSAADPYNTQPIAEGGGVLPCLWQGAGAVGTGIPCMAARINYSVPWLEWTPIRPISLQEQAHLNLTVDQLLAVLPDARVTPCSEDANAKTLLLGDDVFVSACVAEDGSTRVAIGGRACHGNDGTLAKLQTSHLNQTGQGSALCQWYAIGRDSSWLVGLFASIRVLDEHDDWFSCVPLLVEEVASGVTSATKDLRYSIVVEGTHEEIVFGSFPAPLAATPSETDELAVYAASALTGDLLSKKTVNGVVDPGYAHGTRWDFASSPKFGGLRCCVVVQDGGQGVVLALATPFGEPSVAQKLNTAMRMDHALPYALGCWTSSPFPFWPLQDSRVPVLAVPLDRLPSEKHRADVVQGILTWVNGTGRALVQRAH